MSCDVDSDKGLEQNHTMQKRSVGCGRINCQYHMKEKEEKHEMKVQM
jgi:hypothetical protein